MTTPRHLELFIRDNKTVAQCRTETNGRLDDPVSIAVAGPEWQSFVADFNQLQAAEIETLTAEKTTLQADLQSMTAERDVLTARVAELEAELSTGVDENGVPTAITPLQGRIVLKRAGLLAQVEAAITQINGETQVWWEYATLWHRTHPVLVALGESLGFTSEQVDDMFKQAATIS